MRSSPAGKAVTSLCIKDTGRTNHQPASRIFVSAIYLRFIDVRNKRQKSVSSTVDYICLQ